MLLRGMGGEPLADRPLPEGGEQRCDMTKSVAFLGPRGTNSEEAAIAFGGSDAELKDFSNFASILSAVETGIADYGVIPVENSIEGPVSMALDLLIHETSLMLFAEVVVPIRHVLVGKEGARLEDIRTVMSHPQALAQCRNFLDRFMPRAEAVAWMSTGGAVQEVAQGNDPTRAAIGPARAQELYGGAVLAREIQDTRSNMTRFMVMGHHDAEPTGDDKTFVAYKTDKDLPGSLYQSLAPFAEAGLNLTNIITRPTKGWLGEYVFLLDFDGHRKDPHVATALEKVRGKVEELKVIGSCPRFPIEQFKGLVTSSRNT
jgi:prephenate dehydratase